MKTLIFSLVASLWSLICLGQCVTTSLSYNACTFNFVTYTNQAGANNGTAPNPTCGWGTSSSGSSSWIRFTYLGPPDMESLLVDQVAGSAGNNVAAAIYSNDGCNVITCKGNNTDVTTDEANAQVKINLTGLGLIVGQNYLLRVYNEGNTANVKNPMVRCVPSSPCGDSFSSPCLVSNINTTFYSSTNGAHMSDGCTFPTNLSSG
jgi:hypothetical protein